LVLVGIFLVIGFLVVGFGEGMVSVLISSITVVGLPIIGFNSISQTSSVISVSLGADIGSNDEASHFSILYIEMNIMKLSQDRKRKLNTVTIIGANHANHSIY
jgi:hypothetical protein